MNLVRGVSHKRMPGRGRGFGGLAPASNFQRRIRLAVRFDFGGATDIQWNLQAPAFLMAEEDCFRREKAGSGGGLMTRKTQEDVALFAALLMADAELPGPLHPRFNEILTVAKNLFPVLGEVLGFFFFF